MFRKYPDAVQNILTGLEENTLQEVVLTYDTVKKIFKEMGDAKAALAIEKIFRKLAGNSSVHTVTCELSIFSCDWQPLINSLMINQRIHTVHADFYTYENVPAANLVEFFNYCRGVKKFTTNIRVLQRQPEGELRAALRKNNSLQHFTVNNLWEETRVWLGKMLAENKTLLTVNNEKRPVAGFVATDPLILLQNYKMIFGRALLTLQAVKMTQKTYGSQRAEQLVAAIEKADFLKHIYDAIHQYLNSGVAPGNALNKSKFLFFAKQLMNIQTALTNDLAVRLEEEEKIVAAPVVAPNQEDAQLAFLLKHSGERDKKHKLFFVANAQDKQKCFVELIEEYQKNLQLLGKDPAIERDIHAYLDRFEKPAKEKAEAKVIVAESVELNGVDRAHLIMYNKVFAGQRVQPVLQRPLTTKETDSLAKNIRIQENDSPDQQKQKMFFQQILDAACEDEISCETIHTPVRVGGKTYDLLAVAKFPLKKGSETLHQMPEDDSQTFTLDELIPNINLSKALQCLLENMDNPQGHVGNRAKYVKFEKMAGLEDPTMIAFYQMLGKDKEYRQVIFDIMCRNVDGTLLKDPVYLPDGCTYERSYVENVLLKKPEEFKPCITTKNIMQVLLQQLAGMQALLQAAAAQEPKTSTAAIVKAIEKDQPNPQYEARMQFFLLHEKYLTATAQKQNFALDRMYSAYKNYIILGKGTHKEDVGITIALTQDAALKLKTHTHQPLPLAITDPQIETMLSRGIRKNENDSETLVTKKDFFAQLFHFACYDEETNLFMRLPVRDQAGATFDLWSVYAKFQEEEKSAELEKIVHRFAEVLPNNTLNLARAYLAKVLQPGYKDVHVVEGPWGDKPIEHQDDALKAMGALHFYQQLPAFRQSLFNFMLRDRITGKVMLDPVFLPDGFTYDRSTILAQKTGFAIEAALPCYHTQKILDLFKQKLMQEISATPPGGVRLSDATDLFAPASATATVRKEGELTVLSFV